jgi:hypothetical protein
MAIVSAFERGFLKTGLSGLADYGDYWAMDWGFQDDTFMQGWVTYRIRKN